MIYTSFRPRSAALLLHAEQVLGRGGVRIVVLGGAPLLLTLHHSEVPLGELLREAASEGQFNRHHNFYLDKFFGHLSSIISLSLIELLCMYPIELRP